MSSPALNRFLQDRAANIAVVFALSLLPIVFLAGMAMDYTSAELKKPSSMRPPMLRRLLPSPLP